MSAQIELIPEETGIDAKVRTAVDRIKALLRDGETLVVPCSFGKDSSSVLNLTINAVLELRREHIALQPLHVVMADTGIEIPENLHYAHGQIRALKEFASREGLDIRVKVTHPLIKEEMLVRIISGRALPSFPGVKRDCSIDMKQNPMRRALNGISKALKKAGRPEFVKLLGTRFSESAVRGAAMEARGDSATGVRESQGERILCPIADWSTDDVWEFLALSGEGRQFSAYVPDFRETLKIYSAAAGECAAITGGDDRHAPCGGARYGCSLCCAVGDSDRTMEALLTDPAYDYLRGLNDLRGFLVRTRYDFSRRRWVGRDIDRETGCVKIAPNNYSAEMCDLLLRCALTLDRREAQRAQSEGVAPRFELIGPRELIAIDLIWNQDALRRPFQALRAWDDVHRLGIEADVPAVRESPRQPVPQPRWLPVGSYDTDGFGFFDPIGRAVGELCGKEALAPRAGESFSVDMESACLILDLEIESLLRRNGDPHFAPESAFWYYINTGVVEFRAGQDAKINHMLQRALFWQQNGLDGEVDPRSLEARTISNAEHDRLKQAARAKRTEQAGAPDPVLGFPVDADDGSEAEREGLVPRPC